MKSFCHLLPNYGLSLLCMFLLCCMQPRTHAEIEWIWVEGGSFIMGMDEPLVSPGRDTIYGYSLPAHEVNVDGFYLSKYEITVEQFRVFCEQTGRSMPEPPAVSAYGDSMHYEWEEGYPMLVSWKEAEAFAHWVGGRLPTEAEWEYAAKGGKLSKGYAYSGSDTAEVVGWVRENADSFFHPVGLLPPNELGLHDMTGNLNEWVQDWYVPGWVPPPGARHNPAGPDTGSLKVSKGVGWYYGSTDVLSSRPLAYSIHRPEVRYQSGIDERTFGFGFRVARSRDAAQFLR